MKKYIGIFMTLFIFTFFIGGNIIANATSLIVNLVDYKADFLGDPHETAKKTKTTTSGQSVYVYSTTGDRQALISLWVNSSPQTHVGDRWYAIQTGDNQEFDGTSDQVPSSLAGGKYFLKAKLALPWFQVKINGTWTVDA